MKRQWTVAVLVALAASCMTLAACQPSDKRDPLREAEATRLVQEAQDAAAQRAIERDILQAKADKAEAEAEAAYKAVPAATLRNILIYLGIGVGALVLTVGIAFAAVAWVMRRATSVYPDSKGQYPVIVSRGFGWVTYHDASRGLGAGAVYRTPTVLDVVAGALALLRGRPAERPALTAEYPANGSEAAMLQVAEQAQAVGLMAAATRPTGLFAQPAIDRHEAQELVQHAVADASATTGRMAELRLITDDTKNARFEALLEDGDES